ncbi:MAG: HAD-IA family hydrolase [Phycisphaerales bacterium]|nr:HAD-IA family hydrolase [Phycisphaerales bacterium]
MLDPDRYAVLTFDCYGTLIDWERGILDALHRLIARHGAASPGDEELLALHARLEPAAQAGEYRTYREVLGMVARGVGEAMGFTPTPEEACAFADSVGDWPAFRDTPRALARLAERYDLAILSNIDRDLFERTRPSLIGGRGFDFAAVITAEDTRSYKPAIGHFWRAMQTLGVPGARILHVAQSLYHDIVPAQSLGISTVWVNRRTGRIGSGATPPAATPVEPDLEVADLSSLAAFLGC